MTKLGAELAVCASARQELQVRPTLFETWLNNLFLNFTSLLCNDHQGTFLHKHNQHPHPSTAKVKNVWYYTSTPPYANFWLLINFILPAVYQVATNQSDVVATS